MRERVRQRVKNLDFWIKRNNFICAEQYLLLFNRISRKIFFSPIRPGFFCYFSELLNNNNNNRSGFSSMMHGWYGKVSQFFKFSRRLSKSSPTHFRLFPNSNGNILTNKYGGFHMYSKQSIISENSITIGDFFLALQLHVCVIPLIPFIHFGDFRSALLFSNVFVDIIMRNGLLIRIFMHAKKNRLSLNDNKNEMLQGVVEEVVYSSF